MKKTCIVCNEEFKFKPYRKDTAKFCSFKCYWAWMNGRKNELTNGWKNGNIGLKGVHKWLVRNYGKPNRCEFPDCMGRSKIFEWCKKEGASYQKNRNSFMRLCRSCHRKYDMTPQKRDKIIKNLIWYNYL